MEIKLEKIPGVDAGPAMVCKVYALCLDGRSPAMAALSGWAASEQGDYRKIMKVLRLIAQVGRIHDEKKVKKSQNPAHGDVYEARADKGKARLMFFYDENEGLAVVCTNDYWKGKGNQDTAFKRCAELKAIYLKGKGSKPCKTI